MTSRLADRAICAIEQKSTASIPLSGFFFKLESKNTRACAAVLVVLKTFSWYPIPYTSSILTFIHYRLSACELYTVTLSVRFLRLLLHVRVNLIYSYLWQGIHLIISNYYIAMTESAAWKLVKKKGASLLHTLTVVWSVIPKLHQTCDVAIATEYLLFIILHHSRVL